MAFRRGRPAGLADPLGDDGPGILDQRYPEFNGGHGRPDSGLRGLWRRQRRATCSCDGRNSERVRARPFGERLGVFGLQKLTWFPALVQRLLPHIPRRASKPRLRLGPAVGLGATRIALPAGSADLIQVIKFAHLRTACLRQGVRGGRALRENLSCRRQKEFVDAKATIGLRAWLACVMSAPKRRRRSRYSESRRRTTS